MKQFCREHEAWVLSQEPSEEVLAKHLEILRWVQHERLVHLIVTVLTCIAELFVVDLVLLHPETHPWSAVIMLILAVLFYAQYLTWTSGSSFGVLFLSLFLPREYRPKMVQNRGKDDEIEGNSKLRG